MKFSAVALSVVSLAAFAAAQSPASSAPVPTNTSSFTPAQQKCIDACPADGAGVNCKAECLGMSFLRSPAWALRLRAQR